MRYYKLITKDHLSPIGKFDWTPYLPTEGKPGPWTPFISHIQLCQSGYHLTNANHLLSHASDECYEAEPDGRIITDETGDKIVCQRVRLVRKIEAWNDKTLRLFACWCVRQVWHLLTDERSRNAVEVVERYANGEATDKELDAARDTAWAAAWATQKTIEEAPYIHLKKMLGLEVDENLE